MEVNAQRISLLMVTCLLTQINKFTVYYMYHASIYTQVQAQHTCVYVCVRFFCNKAFLTQLDGNLHIKRALHLHLHLCTDNICYCNNNKNKCTTSDQQWRFMHFCIHKFSNSLSSSGGQQTPQNPNNQRTTTNEQRPTTFWCVPTVAFCTALLTKVARIHFCPSPRCVRMVLVYLHGYNFI